MIQSNMNLSSSPERGTFQMENSRKKLMEDPNDQDALDSIEMYKEFRRETQMLEAAPEWAHGNMEHTLRTTPWILDKVRSRESYAQNLYAAMCNNDFQQNQMWPILKGDLWSCSWRHAGGIVADMLQKGDYIDWYCSGMRYRELTDEELSKLVGDQLASYQSTLEYVAECVVTDEIRADLLKLGWIVIEDT